MDKDISFVITMLENCISLLKEANQEIKEPVEDNSIRDKIVQIARSYIGKIPYKYGGKDKNGIDCSGFVQMVLKEAGVCPTNTITNSTGMRQWGKDVKNPQLDNARPGDIVCYNGHVALYVGNNKIIDAGNSVKGISERSISIMPIITIRNVIGD